MDAVPQIVRVSPARAEELLAANEGNRKVRSPYVRQLADAMRAEQWIFNGETIKVADDGTLLDGQHRLMAICEAGVTVPMVVVSGLARPTQDSIDAGRKRKLSDVLGILGHSDVHGLATSLNALHRYRVAGTFGRVPSPTTPQALELLRREPEIIESVRTARAVNKEISGPIGVFAACHHIFRDHDPEKADEFFDKLRTGSNLGASNPIHLLRRLILRARLTPQYELRPPVVAGLTFKAFVAWRDGRQVQVLMFKFGGQNEEQLPSLERVPPKNAPRAA